MDRAIYEHEIMLWMRWHKIKKETLAVKINNHHIGEISSMPIQNLSHFFDDLNLSKMEKEISDQILKKFVKGFLFLLM